MTKFAEGAIAEALTRLLADANKPKGRKGRGKKGKGRAKPTEAERAAHMAANDAECVRIFEAAGFKDVKPRDNVKTYNKWVASGRLVRKGEKAQRVGPFALFHVSQTDALPVSQVTQAAEQTQEHVSA